MGGDYGRYLVFVRGAEFLFARQTCFLRGWREGAGEGKATGLVCRGGVSVVMVDAAAAVVVYRDGVGKRSWAMSAFWCVAGLYKGIPICRGRSEKIST